MKVYLIAIPLFIICALFAVFQTDHDGYIQASDLLKRTAEDAAGAASLYYDAKQYGVGRKVFDKTEGNRVIAYVIQKGLGLDSTMRSHHKKYPNTVNYKVYYFDETGILTAYFNGAKSYDKAISFPYDFTEPASGYTAAVSEPMVIVTIDAGAYHYSLVFIPDPALVRTSGYEYLGY